MQCNVCEQEMLEANGNSDYYVYLCNNWQCWMYARPGIYKAKDPDKAARQPLSRWTPSYERWKAEKRENYRLLRDIGIEPKAANLMAGNRNRTEEALRNGEKNE